MNFELNLLIGENMALSGTEFIRQAISLINSYSKSDELDDALFSLRNALIAVERHFAKLEGSDFTVNVLEEFLIEKVPICTTCGHIFPHSHSEPTDASR